MVFCKITELGIPELTLKRALKPLELNQTGIRNQKMFYDPTILYLMKYRCILTFFL